MSSTETPLTIDQVRAQIMDANKVLFEVMIKAIKQLFDRQAASRDDAAIANQIHILQLQLADIQSKFAGLQEGSRAAQQAMAEILIQSFTPRLEALSDHLKQLPAPSQPSDAANDTRTRLASLEQRFDSFSPPPPDQASLISAIEQAVRPAVEGAIATAMQPLLAMHQDVLAKLNALEERFPPQGALPLVSTHDDPEVSDPEPFDMAPATHEADEPGEVPDSAAAQIDPDASANPTLEAVVPASGTLDAAPINPPLPRHSVQALKQVLQAAGIGTPEAGFQAVEVAVALSLGQVVTFWGDDADEWIDLLAHFVEGDVVYLRSEMGPYHLNSALPESDEKPICRIFEDFGALASAKKNEGVLMRLRARRATEAPSMILGHADEAQLSKVLPFGPAFQTSALPRIAQKTPPEIQASGRLLLKAEHLPELDAVGKALLSPFDDASLSDFRGLAENAYRMLKALETDETLPVFDPAASLAFGWLLPAAKAWNIDIRAHADDFVKGMQRGLDADRRIKSFLLTL